MRHNEARHQQHHFFRLHLLEAWHRRLDLEGGESGRWLLSGGPFRHDVGDVVFVHGIVRGLNGHRVVWVWYGGTEVPREGTKLQNSNK